MVLPVVFLVLYYSISDVSSQSLKLEVNPSFEFVDEDWTVGEALPRLSICAIYEGSKSPELAITSGDSFNYFKIHPVNDSCWTLVLQKTLDADQLNSDGSRGQQFALTFRCYDGLVQAYKNLDIQVVDINDNPPRFVDTDNAVSIPENTKPNQVIFSVKTFDPDTGVGGINHFRLLNDFDQTFGIRNGSSCTDSKCSADVLLLKPVNYERRNVYPLEIIAFDGAGRIQKVNTVNFKVVINVADEQNNPPKFITDSRIRYVPENTAVGEKVFQVQAVDGDSGVSTPNRILYELLLGSPHFRIENTTGWVVVADKLDRESFRLLRTNGAIAVSVQAEEDTAEPRPRSSINFTVVVTDVDDEVPRCNQSRYFAHVMENSQSLIPITLENASQLYVFDRDQGSNGQFSVSLQGEGAEWFDVSPKIVFQEAVLLIRVHDSTSLDYETLKSVTIRVVLTSRHHSTVAKTGGCDVIIKLKDANDNAPQFSQSEFNGTIFENQSPGTYITKITFFDADTEIYLPIVLTLNGNGAERFLVERNGTVRSAVTFDREEKPEYHLTVVAADDGGRGNRESVPLRIAILDKNDNPPVFKEEVFAAFLYENSRQFQFTNGFFVEAIDSDERGTKNSKVTYFWQRSEVGQTLNFILDPKSGEIKPISPGVDREKMSLDHFNFTVLAVDGGEPQLTGSAVVLIYVNDTNDNKPIFEEAIYNVTIMENVTSGHFVIRVTATDKDKSQYNSQIAYRITDVQDKFLIHSKTGDIYIAEGASVDRDRAGKDEYRLTVVAVDQGFPQQTGSTVVNIKVEDVNNKPPRFSANLYEVAVFEHASVNTTLINLTAVDPDENAKLEYKIVRYKDALTKDGKAVLQQQYDYTKLFNIRLGTGEVYIQNMLDREQLRHVTIVVNVTDVNATMNQPQNGQTLVDITVLDVNDNAPKFEKTSYMKSVQENAEVGSVIMSLTATDPDSNHTVIYSLSEEARSLVRIHPTTGELTVAGQIDYEILKWLNFTAAATDTGTPSLVSKVPVSLKILDQNDNSPIFQPVSSYSVSVPEDAQVGTVVLQINATDLDSGDFGRISYFLLNELGGSGEASFVIDQRTGVISVNNQLDRETKDAYALTVKAVDDYSGHLNPDSHESTAVVEVRLTDVNDNAPEFPFNAPRLLTLTESNSADLHVATFSATDRDDKNTGNGRVRYYLIGGNLSSSDMATSQMFNLEPESGLLTLAVDLTGLSGVYSITIQARDLGQPISLSTNINVTVQIEDYNDNKPFIYQPPQKATFSVPENNLTDFFAIAEVRARDKDEGENADLRYKIKPTTANDDWRYFTVDPISGGVYLKQELDFEKQRKYVLTVEACDSGKTPLCDEVEFFVDVLDANDNCPYFDRTLNFIHEISVPENQPVGTVVGKILAATDKDTSADNVKVCYQILNKDPDNAPFRLSGFDTIQIMTTEILDRESVNSYGLVVRATDCQKNKICGNTDNVEYEPMDRSMVLINIKVSDMNDNPPKFVQHLFRGGIQYDTKIGSRVTKIRATDPDAVDTGYLVYSFSGPIVPQLSSGTVNTERKPFFLNKTTGDLTTNIVFQPAWKGTFQCTVLVNDSAGHTDTAKVVINLLSFDQQVELVFESPANRIWDEAADIIKLLSEVTESNATIDDVQPYDRTPDDKTLDSQSKVLVHFTGAHRQEIVAVEDALQSLDIPKTASQRLAKRKLISLHNLKYAGQNITPLAFPDYTLHFVAAGVIAGLFLILTVLVVVWCLQNRRYKRKLKAATTIAFGSTDIAAPSYDLPGTNLHSNSNPVWTGNYGAMENYGMAYDQISQTSKNSLDENEVEVRMEKDTVSSALDRTLPSSKNCISVSQAFENGKMYSPPSQTFSQNSRTSTVQKNCPLVNGSTAADSDGFYCAPEVDGTSPQPNCSLPVIASLESTEF